MARTARRRWLPGALAALGGQHAGDGGQDLVAREL